MRRRGPLRAALALLVLSSLTAPSTSAATEVGNDCVASASAKNLTLVALTRVGNPFPLAAPRAGVVTRWKMQVEPGGDLLPQRLLVLRQIGEGGEFLAVDESESELVEGGANEFATRIPVKAGDRFGLSGLTGTYFCEGDTGLSGLYRGEVPVGETRRFELSEGIGTPVRAIVEPDRDRDGYGDERQDKCPQSAAFHREACSPVRLKLEAKVRERSILVRVRADMAISVQVFGQASWGIRPKRRGPAGRRKGNVGLIVGLAGGTKEVRPGRATSFAIALPKTVMRRLGRIPPRESVHAEITARATDSDGALAERRIRLRLPGKEGA